MKLFDDVSLKLDGPVPIRPEYRPHNLFQTCPRWGREGLQVRYRDPKDIDQGVKLPVHNQPDNQTACTDGSGLPVSLRE